MKSKASKQNEFDPKEGFEIKNPAWAFWVCLLATLGGLIAFFVILCLKMQNRVIADTFYIGCVVLALSIFPAVGVYVCIYEKFIYKNDVYKYYGAFRKPRIASIGKIGSVKFLTVYYLTKYGLRSKIRIFFYDNSKNIIIKIIDDGTLSKNEMFLKSLKYNRIKIIREEKYDY
ncbi:MAG: hypothetical protein IKJ35_06620 [Clostridia bacterium]|nr:hypothetical protein [Clostridia bacterium]